MTTEVPGRTRRWPGFAAGPLLGAWPLLGGILALGACQAQPSASASKGLSVVATVTQVSAFTRAVGGDHIQLTALLKSSDDPHAYEPHPSDISVLAQARLIVKSGVGLDRWIDKPISAAAPGARVLDASTGARIRSGGGEGQDPHWWYDVDNAKIAADNIAGALAGLDPSNAAAYRANAAAQKARLDDADHQAHNLIDPIPAARRLFVANHDAFNYFLARYGITLVGDIIPSTDSLAAVRPQDTARLISAIRDRHVKAIFTETTLDPNIAHQVASETQARVFDGKLYGDAIGAPGTDGATLEGALLHNARLMAAAFGS